LFNTGDYWVSVLFPSSGIRRNTEFRKLDLFPSSGEGRRNLFCWLCYKDLISTRVTEVATSCQRREIQKKETFSTEHGISMTFTQKLIFEIVNLHVKYNINRKLEVR
jgi:hypothetical protein